MNSPDIRKEKPTGLLVAFFVLTGLAIILWLVVVGAHNHKAANTQCEIDGKKGDAECEEYKMSDMYQMNLKERKKSWAGPVIVLLVFIGVIIGIMFLKGYPFSSYMSYSQCSDLAAKDPYGGWAWSLPYLKSSWANFVCKWFGACECRSLNRENDCASAAITNPKMGFVYNDQIAARKNQQNTCACCNSSGSCGKLDLNSGNIVGCEFSN